MTGRRSSARAGTDLLFRPAIARLLAVALGVLAAGGAFQPSAARQQNRPAAPATNFADWVEPDFPFFSSVLDARKAGAAFPADNLTPRGLILNLGSGYWAAFDVDLLRVAAIWQGRGVTPRALAPGSYNNPDRKTPGGQFPAPEPDGEVRLANGIYPGWQSGDAVSLDDPRSPAPSPEEVGRGPLPESVGRFKAVRLVRDGGAVLEYTAGRAAVREWIVPAGGTAVVRHFEVTASAAPLTLVIGAVPEGTAVAAASASGPAPAIEIVQRPRPAAGAGSSASPVQIRVARIAPHPDTIRFAVAVGEHAVAASDAARALPSDPPATRWRQEVTSPITLAASNAPFVTDDIALPVDNPWRRNIRPGDIQFLRDGTGALVTLDGDVWLVRGLQDRSGIAHWRRFASGLHEPLTLAIRDAQIYVFDRNGIWRLADTDGNGEADVHELFSNAFAQTADMREFPSTIRLGPDGEFVIAKGGQEATTIGKHNGSVLRISADGRTATVLGYGFRQPNISVNPKTGLVIASDQQGHYIPSTPLHIVRDRQFYGFLSDKLPREVYPAPIAEPLTWIPHTANASALSQVWMYGARMGPLNDRLVHIGYNNPELFLVLMNERTARPQASVVSITRDLDFPTLNGSVNPVDGQLYLAGFQILGWGTTATRLAGLGRVRYTGAASTLPRDVVPMDKGVLLRFDVPLDKAKAVDPANYSVASWHYKRTYQYGSPQLRADGTTGIDPLPTSSAYLSRDRRSVFVGVPDMKPVMQMRVTWSLATADGRAFQSSAYTTPYELPAFAPAAEGFEDLAVDLSPRTAAVERAEAASVEQGRRVYQLYGCMACHTTDKAAPSRLGPTWSGLYGRERPIAGGVLRAVADEAYLRESILQPAAKVVDGYQTGESGMPSYAGVLTDPQIESLILFIKSLQ